jgi:hypothetical protein
MSRRVELVIPLERPTKAGWYWYEGIREYVGSVHTTRVKLSRPVCVIESMSENAGLCVEFDGYDDVVLVDELTGTWRWLGEGR